MIKFNCAECIHSQVCSFKDKATQEARNFDKAVNVSILEHDLRCKHYGSVTLKGWESTNEY